MNMSREHDKHRGAVTSVDTRKKKPYEKPRICGREFLETIASACDPPPVGKAAPPTCQTFLQS